MLLIAKPAENALMKIRTLVFAVSLISSVSGFAGPGIKGLDAPGPAAEWAAKLMLFGQFAGDWECDVVLLNTDGSKTKGSCEWHFSWILEGKAIQDVWIAHYNDPKPGAPTDGYGTTLRWYDPKADAWHVIWVSARDNTTHAFAARKVENEIVLESQDRPSHPYRWIFSDITPASFRWRSEGSPDGGKTWIVGQEMSARRIQMPSPNRDPDRDRKTIEKLEREWLNGESDRPTLERILAGEFVHPVSAGIFLTKQQHIDWSVQHPRPAGRKAHFEKLEVRLYGDTAIVTGIVDDTDSSGKDSRRSIFTDVFVYRTGEWQAVSAEENAIVSRP
jgi:Domain of unknown function (DUF4440)